MDQVALSFTLRRAIVGALSACLRRVSKENPYAFALMPSQCGDDLGFAVATEEGLRQVADAYFAKGYRCRREEWEDFDDQHRLAEWLRWANPDDGWHHGDFAVDLGIPAALAHLARGGIFGEDLEGLEEFCTEVLAALQSDPAWLEATSGMRIIVGVTSGEDPRDFLRTATRANDYQAVLRIWAEFIRGEELSAQITTHRSEGG